MIIFVRIFDVQETSLWKQTTRKDLSSFKKDPVIAGFVMSLITLFFGWIPVFGWVIWILSLVFSFIAVFKRPRGLAIAGLILSIVGLIFIVFLYALIAALAADEL